MFGGCDPDPATQTRLGMQSHHVDIVAGCGLGSDWGDIGEGKC